MGGGRRPLRRADIASIAAEVVPIVPVVPVVPVVVVVSNAKGAVVSVIDTDGIGSDAPSESSEKPSDPAPRRSRSPTDDTAAAMVVDAIIGVVVVNVVVDGNADIGPNDVVADALVVVVVDDDDGGGGGAIAGDAVGWVVVVRIVAVVVVVGAGAADLRHDDVRGAEAVASGRAVDWRASAAGIS
jgi:hypothetical protein